MFDNLLPESLQEFPTGLVIFIGIFIVGAVVETVQKHKNKKKTKDI